MIHGLANFGTTWPCQGGNGDKNVDPFLFYFTKLTPPRPPLYPPTTLPSLTPSRVCRRRRRRRKEKYIYNFPTEDRLRIAK